MQSPPVSPSYDYPSRAYPYPHVPASKAHTTPSCIPPAPPPTASTPSAALGEYFFPFPVDSPRPESNSEYMTTPRTHRSLSNPSDQQQTPSTAGFPAVPRRSSFNYVHDLAEYSRRHSALKEGSDSESPEEGSKEGGAAGSNKHRPRRLSLKDYLPLGRLPLPHSVDSDSEGAIEEDTADNKPGHKHHQNINTLTPPESPVHHQKEHRIPRHYHQRHHTTTAPVLMSSSNSTTGTATHNCFSSEDMKHIQHVHMLVEQAVDAFVVAGEDHRRRRESFGGDGHGFTTAPARMGSRM